MTDLSPAAQAVIDAFLVEWPDEALEQDLRCLAAALRAAADEVVPETNNTFISSAELQQEKTRDQLLAMADELETQP